MKRFTLIKKASPVNYALESTRTLDNGVVLRLIHTDCFTGYISPCGPPQSGIKRNGIDHTFSRNLIQCILDSLFHPWKRCHRTGFRSYIMLVISHDDHIIYNPSLLSPVIMACEILRNRVIH